VEFFQVLEKLVPIVCENIDDRLRLVWVCYKHLKVTQYVSLGLL